MLKGKPTRGDRLRDGFRECVHLLDVPLDAEPQDSFIEVSRAGDLQSQRWRVEGNRVEAVYEGPRVFLGYVTQKRQCQVVALGREALEISPDG